MLAIVSTWFVIATMLLGGAGVTAYAAQESLPAESLYPIKIFGEEMRLALSPGPKARVELMFHYSERRADEILELAAQSKPVPEGVTTRWREQFNLALQAASQLDEPEMIHTLGQIMLRLRLQEEKLQAVQANRPEGATSAMESVRVMLRLVDGALKDPETFRLGLQRQNFLEDQSQAGENGRRGAEEALSPGSQDPQSTCTPALDGTGPGPGPQNWSGTAQPGPGPQSTPYCDTCTPALDGTGPGPGPQNQGGKIQAKEESSSSPAIEHQGTSGSGDCNWNCGQDSGEKPPDSPGTGGDGGGNRNRGGSGGGGSPSSGTSSNRP